MLAALKMLGAVAVMVVPGGLTVLAAWLFARVVAERLKTIEGERRLLRAITGIRFRDVWNQARAAL